MGKPLDDVIKKMDGRKAANLLDKYDAVELLVWVIHLSQMLSDMEHRSVQYVVSAKQLNDRLEQSLERIREAAITHPAIPPRDSEAPVEPETKPHGVFDPDRAQRRRPTS